MNRRDFLRATGFFTVSAAGVLAGCGDDGDGSEAKGTYAFPQGVASGDPRDASVVFWTRAVRTDAAAVSDVAVTLEVATDERFSSVIGRVALVAQERFDFTVRHKLTGLQPYTRYYYRFVAGKDASTSGQARTTPRVDMANPPTELRFAFFTCQDWLVNHWEAMRWMAAEELDFVVHLGDYIYEAIGQSFQAGQAEQAHTELKLPNGTALSSGGRYATTLADYRYLYRTYRSDARLQNVHSRFPAIMVWDDHEFTDDSWQDRQTYTNENKTETSRRRIANQAWAEYTPVDWGDIAFNAQATTGFDNIRIYRDIEFGSLMHLVMTDQRLYRDDHLVNEAAYARQLLAVGQAADPVNGDNSIGARYFVPRPLLQQAEGAVKTALGREPQILGPTQTAWWKDRMAKATAVWKVWGNEVTLNRMWLDLRNAAPAPFNQLYVVNADVWDGYPSHKKDLMSFLKTGGIQNVVAITGDLHAFQAGVVRDDVDSASAQPVLADFVSAGISSGSFYSYVRAGAQATPNNPLAPLVTSPATFNGTLKAANPDFAYVDFDAQGYASVRVTAQTFEVTFVKVNGIGANGALPSPVVAKRTRIALNAGSLELKVTDNV